LGVVVRSHLYSPALLVGLLFAFTPAEAAPPKSTSAAHKAALEAQRDQMQFQSPEAIARWINQYRQKPEPQRLSAAVKAMSQLGVFKDTENSGLYLGFAAGVLGSNPALAEDLITKMFPMPPEDHIAIIKAIAYSGLPNWKEMLRRFAERMPARAVVVDKYLTDKLPPLATLPLDGGPAPLDIMWGWYFASGSFEPVMRIVNVLSWSKDGNKVDRLTIGSMAKWTLAQNAARDMELLRMLKTTVAHESKENAAILREVVEAAEIGDVGKIRKDALSAIETLKVKGSEASRNYSWWGQAGQTALALGCITASALGQVQVGVPCVIGGALSGAALMVFKPTD
jgi:hypothetical protein